MSAWETNDMKEALPEQPTFGGTLPANNANNGNIEEWQLEERINYDYSGGGEGRVWESASKVYEWDGEEGDLGPQHPELEVMLFGNLEERGDIYGIDFTKYDRIEVTQEGVKRIQPIKSFDTAGLHPAMRQNIAMSGYRVPTPIQRYCIPAIKMGFDLIAIAQTGSGKTAAYLIPILDHLMGKAKKLAAWRPSPQMIAEGHPAVRAEPLVVIICPARELAIQIFNEARKLCYRSMLRPAVVYGGGPLREQQITLGKGCDVLVASPGRLIDMMERPHVLSLRRVKYMVIDEADEMLHDNWQEEMNKMLSGGEQEEGNVKYMLFSATFPTAVRKLAKTHLAETHCRIRVGRLGSTLESIQQDIVYVDHFKKKDALIDLLSSQKPARTIIFVNSKRMADELDDFLWNKELPCTSMHSDRTQSEREDSIRAFRAGKAPIMITTGVSARGIDVRHVMHVINYDLPSMDYGGIQEYVHRIGRTGRIGHRGLATSFYNDKDEPIAKLLTMTLVEMDQEVPDFLEIYKPDETDKDKLKFEYGSDEEDPDEGGWAPGGGDIGGDTGGDAGGGWGAPAAADIDTGFNGGGGDTWASGNGDSNGGAGDGWGGESKPETGGGWGGDTSGAGGTVNW
ncbi:P-loop containing nucleoside triphosphate hydrolase protein [Xylariaceae sp. FL0016]|nr:P-loop containing nucleoside triphosphate hydrolase protein [Xylariaceae sp. FL0016]